MDAILFNYLQLQHLRQGKGARLLLENTVMEEAGRAPNFPQPMLSAVGPCRE
jgi:hypothetical protein